MKINLNNKIEHDIKLGDVIVDKKYNRIILISKKSGTNLYLGVYIHGNIYEVSKYKFDSIDKLVDFYKNDNNEISIIDRDKLELRYIDEI